MKTDDGKNKKGPLVLGVKSKVAEREERILDFWNTNKIFEKTLKKDAPKGNYVFYDGPPFATGLPHYGHILASTIKDAVPRYQTMKGAHVARRWGWDCHGLPIENIVEKDLGISGKKQIEELGVEKFNTHARSKVLTYVSEWKKTVDRIGRWVDFDGSYKTMDNTFIESVWWALKETHGKGLIYEGTRVLPYCPRCETPIANSEIAMDNSYKDITDISVYAKFELADEPGIFVLAWTTTPWTLPGNFALAVNPEIEYVKIEIAGIKYILAKERLSVVKEEYSVLENFTGKELVGKKYKPLFSYFTNQEFKGKEKAWEIYGAEFVTVTDGSGIVHIAPGYGEDDMNLAKKEGIPFIHHVGHDGKFTDAVKDFAGISVKPKGDHQSGDVYIIKYLAHNGLLFAKEKIVHSYPHCFRCETPLYYYAIPAWFIKIADVKKRILDLNEKINWIPAHLKEGRFKKSAEGAPDWNISRNRYWASPLPIWKCDSCREVEFLGSLAELKKKTSRGNSYFLMRHGEAENNVKRIISSNLAENHHHLTEKGKEQAKNAAESLRSEGIDLVFASPFARTMETAEIVAKEIGIDPKNIVVEERIGEVNAGEFHGKSVEEYHAYFLSYEERFTKAPEGGEDHRMVKNRMMDFIADLDLKYSGKKILLVTHDSPAWLLASGVEGKSAKEALVMRGDSTYFVENAHVRKLDYAPFPHNADYELDFHRPYIDDIAFACQKCGNGTMKRIPEVIDCWFESASMPFAANHYPFENTEWFKKNFPAQFVAEYIAQTRTWFYYTHAVSTILFDSIPFENVVTTGTVLAEDGQKMSKSKGNFPDPWILFNKYGVDAVRYYLLSSPIMRSEDLNFSEKDVDGVFKKLISRLDNVVSFYELYRANLPGEKFGEYKNSNHVLDLWIQARLAGLVKEVTLGMDVYQIDRAVRPLDAFIEDLSTWYVRRSRDRFKGEDVQDQVYALATTRYVLFELAKLMAPFTPFVAEDVYMRLGNALKESVHLEDWPALETSDETLLEEMDVVRKAVSFGLEARAKAGIKVRQPLSKLILKSESLKGKKDLLSLIEDEVNVKSVAFDTKIDEEVVLDTVLTPELKEEGTLRDLIRNIQELRKTSNFIPSEKANLSVQGDMVLGQIIKKFEKEIKTQCGITTIVFKEGEEKLEISK